MKLRGKSYEHVKKTWIIGKKTLLESCDIALGKQRNLMLLTTLSVSVLQNNLWVNDQPLWVND